MGFRQAGWIRLGCMAAAAVIAATACGSSNTPGGPTLQVPPTANIKPPTSIGAGEGALNLVLWDGYADKSWVDPFTTATGCKVNQHPAGSSDEMVSLMKDGGGGNWDMVSASGDADLRLIYSGDVVPMNTALIPDWSNFQPYFQGPPYNTIAGIHYGISLQWGPNTLLYNTKKFVNPPTSWSVIYDAANKGLVTVPDNPIQIADAALYLSKTTPSRRLPSVRRRSTARPAPRWRRSRPVRAPSITPTRAPRISTRSSSGRRRSRSARMAPRSACPTTSGSPPGPRSRAKCRLKR